MAVEYVTRTLYFWNYASGGAFYSSPSVGDGEILATIKVDNDGRQAIATPYIQSGTRYFTVALNYSGGGTAWGGSAKICYHLTPDSGVNSIWQSSQAQGTFIIMTLKGVSPISPIGQTGGGYGIGNPNRSYNMTPDDDENSLILGGAHCGTGGGYYGSGNEGTNLWLKESDYDGDLNEYRRTKFHQYSELSSQSYGTQVYHYYEWGGYPNNVLVMVEFLAAIASQNQAIFCM